MIFDEQSFKDFVLATPDFIKRHRTHMIQYEVREITDEKISGFTLIGTSSPLDLNSMGWGDAEAAALGQMLHWLMEAEIIPRIRLHGFWWNKVHPRRCLGYSGAPGAMEGVRKASELLAMHACEVLSTNSHELEDFLLEWGKIRAIGYREFPEERPGNDDDPSQVEEWLTLNEAEELTGRGWRTIYRWYKDGLLETTKEGKISEMLFEKSSLEKALKIKSLK